MKTSFYSSLILFGLIIIFTACQKHDVATPTSQCSASDSTVYTRSINAFDFNPSSIFYNQVVMNFRFTQIETTCPSDGSFTDLIIQNITPYTISFNYNINFLLNYAQWNYQNVAVIPPLSSIDFGQINQNPARVDLANISIQGSTITYR